MNATLAERVWQRARGCCEYCRMPQSYDIAPFEIDHIISKKHHGLTIDANLALSCFWCNAHKGSDIAARDDLTRKLAPLFNPRRHKWSRHFRWRGSHLLGRTAVGRVTISLLKINDPFRVKLRESLRGEGIVFGS